MTAQDMLDSDYVDLLPRDLLVPHYLIHCYLYYEQAESIISDHQFDMLARRLWEEWDEVEHVHAHLIDPNALLSGGSYLKGRYPLRVKSSAARLLGRPLRFPW